MNGNIILIGILLGSTINLQGAVQASKNPCSVKPCSALTAVLKSIIPKRATLSRFIPSIYLSRWLSSQQMDPAVMSQHMHEFKEIFAQFPPGLFDLILSYSPELYWYGAPYASRTQKSTINPLSAYRYSPDERHAAFIEEAIAEGGYKIHNIVVVATDTDEPIFKKQITIHADPTHDTYDSCFFSTIAWSRDGRLLAYRDDAHILVVNPFKATADPLFRFRGSSAAWSSHDNNCLAITGNYHYIYIYNVLTKTRSKPIIKIDSEPTFFKTLLWLPNSNCIAALSKGHPTHHMDIHPYKGSIIVYEAATGNVHYTIKLHESAQQRAYTDAAFSSDGSKLALGGEGHVAIYDARTGGLQRFVGERTKEATLNDLTWLDTTTLCVSLKPELQQQRATSCNSAVILNTDNGAFITTLVHNQLRGYYPYSLSYSTNQRQLLVRYRHSKKETTRLITWQPDLRAPDALNVTSSRRSERASVQPESIEYKEQKESKETKESKEATTT